MRKITFLEHNSSHQCYKKIQGQELITHSSVTTYLVTSRRATLAEMWKYKLQFLYPHGNSPQLVCEEVSVG